MGIKMEEDISNTLSWQYRYNTTNKKQNEQSTWKVE